LTLRTRSITAIAAAALLAVPATAAQAAKGSITDRGGDNVDIVKLSYNNAKSKVTLTTKYADSSTAQVEFFAITWAGPNKGYGVVSSAVTGDRELVYSKNKSDEGTTIACKGLNVKRNARANTTKVIVPRTCLTKAPDKLRFQAGALNVQDGGSDETKRTKKVKRG
jgi:hypothetical protein